MGGNIDESLLNRSFRYACRNAGYSTSEKKLAEYREAMYRSQLLLAANALII
jgi:hypothetical protein